MNAENQRTPIGLPGLESTRFNLISAAVQISTETARLEHPLLFLEGEEDAFSLTVSDGHLIVEEKPNNGIIIGGNDIRKGSKVVGSVSRSTVISGNSVKINGVNVEPSDSVYISNVRRKAALLLPEGYQVSQDVNTVSGSVELEGLAARKLRAASTSGKIIVSNTTVGEMTLKSVSGKIDVGNISSQKEVKLETVSGKIDVNNSSAPYWRLKSVSGSITVINSKGQFDTSSVSGRKSINR